MKRNPKIVIASDSFKGSLTSMEVAEAVASGVMEVYPSAEVFKVKIADGGEGTTEAILENVGGEQITCMVSNPLGRKIEASYGIIDNGTTAIIETAAASGLTLLLHDERNPLITSSYGTGELIADAMHRGCRRFMIGLGGSATNDGGIGLLSALGYKFHNQPGHLLHGSGASLAQVNSIDTSDVLSEVFDSEFIAACDVDNPFYGPQGAARIFAPQKGADPLMVDELDKGMEHFSRVIREFSGKDISSAPGVGAAGGLGGGLMAFLNARLVPGIDFVLDAVHFDELIAGADLVITGEGRIDAQTARGKAPAGVLKRARQQGIKTIALGGAIGPQTALGFDSILQTTPPDMPLTAAMNPTTARTNIINTIIAYLHSHPLP